MNYVNYLEKLGYATIGMYALMIIAAAMVVAYFIGKMPRKRTMAAVAVLGMATSCTTVDSGHRGVEVSWGGETNMSKVYPEGMSTGLHWVWDDLVEYDVREKTYTEKFTFNDVNNMNTGVEIALDYFLMPEELAKLHTQITDVQVKIQKTLKSAGKEVVPQYSASDLNLRKREEAEQKLTEILSRELPQFYVGFARVQVTDVDIPNAIAQAAEQTAQQQELNKLALEKAQESENNYKAAEWDAKTKQILSQPAMLELKKLEIEEMWAKKGVSPYGNNNVFGNMEIIKGIR